MSKRISYTVSGKVQGVFFRDFTEEQASKLGLTGWVVGEAQGEQSALDNFVKALHKGPSAARVTGVEQKDLPTKHGEAKFER